MILMRLKGKKYINEDYYLKSKADCVEGIASYADMLVENDEYNCGEAHRESSIADCHLKILMLDFTAGQPISLMPERFDSSLNALSMRLCMRRVLIRAPGLQ